MRTITVGSLVAALIVVTGVADAQGQALTMDMSVGRIDYPAVTTDVGSAHMMGTVRYETAPWASVYGGAAVPLRAGDPFWTSGGGTGRWRPAGASGRRVTFGVDFGTEAFLFRDRLIQRTGSGASLDALPFVQLPAGHGHVEVRAGWRGQVLSLVETTDRRGVFETGARLISGTTVQFEADTRFVHADGTTYPFVGAAVSGGYPVNIRIAGGKWLSDVASEVAWSAGVTAPLGWQATLWAGVRQEAPDPLYWNASRRTWSVGVTRSLGRARRTTVSGPVSAGTVEIRVAARDVSGDSISIAGDFNNWQPTPMRREGDDWVVRVPLVAGVYHYAFRTAAGQWFVPTSFPNRRSDGFGGYVATLVVS